MVYWLGYSGQPVKLQALPEGIDVINLFLLNLSASPDSGTSLSTSFITSKGNSWQEILSEARSAQARGMKVCISVMSPNGELTWNSIPDPEAFAKNVHDLVNEWGLDGVDIDPEMSLNESPIKPNENFTAVVKALSKYFGPLSGTGKILSFVSYELSLDGELLKATNHLFDHVMLMGYFWDYTTMISHFNDYAAIVDPAKLLPGVSPAGPTTPLSEVTELATWQPAGSVKGGMMEYNINADADFTYATAIIRIIKPV